MSGWEPGQAVPETTSLDRLLQDILGDLPDPVARAMDGLMAEISRLQARVKELEERAEEAPSAPLEGDKPEAGEATAAEGRRS